MCGEGSMMKHEGGSPFEYFKSQVITLMLTIQSSFDNTLQRPLITKSLNNQEGAMNHHLGHKAYNKVSLWMDVLRTKHLA